ncbi:MAG: SH3 domain-containing protein [Burkholderiales bacterium]|nr:SH3 domain-containing protein [Anaerolineae bacterium]
MSMRGRSRRSNDGPPRLIVFMAAIGVVFGVYYLGIGIRNFLRSGGLGVIEVTQQADVITTATAVRSTLASLPQANASPRPTSTPLPACMDFIVTAGSAIVRDGPSTNAAIVTQLNNGETVCVLGRAEGENNAEWYLIDNNPESRRLEAAYMHESIISPVNPTPRPSITPTRLPTITDTPTTLPTITQTRPPSTQTPTRDSDVPDTPTATLSPTPTIPMINA